MDLLHGGLTAGPLDYLATYTSDVLESSHLVASPYKSTSKCWLSDWTCQSTFLPLMSGFIFMSRSFPQSSSACFVTPPLLCLCRCCLASLSLLWRGYQALLRVFKHQGQMHVELFLGLNALSARREPVSSYLLLGTQPHKHRPKAGKCTKNTTPHTLSQ